MQRQWTLVIPAPAQWITANDILGKHSRYKRAELVRLWRGATVDYARQARLPQGLTRVLIESTAQFRGKPPVRDASNLDPTLKAIVDGLGPSRLVRRAGKVFTAPGYGLVPDDDDKHVELPRMKIAGELLPPRPYGSVGQVTLLITEVAS